MQVHVTTIHIIADTAMSPAAAPTIGQMISNGDTAVESSSVVAGGSVVGSPVVGSAVVISPVQLAAYVYRNTKNYIYTVHNLSMQAAILVRHELVL